MAMILVVGGLCALSQGCMADPEPGTTDGEAASESSSALFAAEAACYWSGWVCGYNTCAPGFIMTGIDFNINRSEGCWGSGNDYDEPQRRIQCCLSSSPIVSTWTTAWGCGAMTCPSGWRVIGVDFNATRSEGCWGSGNDYDEPMRRVQCGQLSPPRPSSCSWLNWGCGEMTCPGGWEMAGVDFNANQSEGCWGSGNDYDEPQRRIMCCAP